jgi:hypothetical protein
MLSVSQTIISSAIDEINEESENDGIKISKLPSTQLLGVDSSLDSLLLIRLLITVERLIEEQTGKVIVIVEESSLDFDQSPFSTLQSLTQHIDKLLSN